MKKLNVLRVFKRNYSESQLPCSDRDSLDDFGRIVLYEGDTYEWVAYDRGPKGYDYELIYCKIDNPGSMAVDEIISFAPWQRPCECGATKIGSKGHSYWCPAWEKMI